MTGDLMDDRRCRAKSKRTGERCKRYPVPGGLTCYFHGGASGKALAAAERRRAEAEATVLLEQIWDPAAEPVTDPIRALQRLAGKLEHAGDVLGAKVSTTDMDGGTALAFTKVLQLLHKSLEALERLNLSARHVELEQARADLVLSWLTGAAEAGRRLPVGTAPGQVVETVLGAFVDAMRQHRAVSAAGSPTVVRGELE